VNESVGYINVVGTRCMDENAPNETHEQGIGFFLEIYI
jgi:hypothetical protein